MKKFKLLGGMAIASVVLALSAVTAFAAGDTYACPRGYEECNQNGACVYEDCAQYSCGSGNGSGATYRGGRGGCCGR